MKKQFLKMILASAVIICSCLNKSTAQTWNLIGNSNATSTSILGTTNAIPLNFTTNNVSRLVIDASGKIGIGTAPALSLMTLRGAGTTPASSWISSGAPLIAGFGEGTPGNADLNLMMAAAASNARGVIGMKRARGTLAAPAAVQQNDQLGSLLASGFDGSNFQGAAAVDFFADGVPLPGMVPARISFVTGSSGATRVERLKIGSTGNFTFNNTQLFLDNGSGNVGVGTTSPGAKLEVSGQIKITGGTPGLGKVLTSDLSGLASWQNLPSGGSSQWTASANDIYNTNIGNVGIGTTAPQVKLHVQQDGEAIRLSGTNSFIQVANNANTPIGYMWNNNGDFQVGVSSLNTGGYLKLANATNPVLTIYNNNTMGYMSSTFKELNSKDLLLNAYTTPSTDVPGNMHLQVTTSGTFTNRAGNLSVGTTDASMAKMTVQGAVGQSVAMFRRSSSSAGLSIAADWPEIYFNSYYNGGVKSMKAGYGGLIGLDPTSGNLYFRTGSAAASSDNGALSFADAFIINKDGNVGMGTYTPGYKLEVCGTIRSKEVRVETGWCDFVFSDDYRLRSLKEVENFIKTNKHLPDVTAGNEIETNGLEVGKTSAQMIRKIEELTLYAIDQQKSIDMLKEQNARLESAINSLMQKGGK